MGLSGSAVARVRRLGSALGPRWADDPRHPLRVERRASRFPPAVVNVTRLAEDRDARHVFHRSGG